MNGLHDMNVPHGRKLTWGFVLSTTYGLYREHFWALFRIGLPIALLTYLFKPLRVMLANWLYSFLFRHGIEPVTAVSAWVFEISLAVVTGAVYWSLSALFFAGIAGKLLSHVEEERGVSDAYTPVRRRLPALLAVALITWIVFILGRTILLLAMSLALDRLHFYPASFWGSTLVFGLPLLLVAGLVSRAVLAIPELVVDSTVSPLRAIRNSIRKMEDWEPFFAFFLAKAAVVGYGVYWLAIRGFHFLWSHTSISESAYSWITWGVYICLFAMLSSPLFIAACVLYHELRFKQEEATAMSAPAI